MLRGTYSEAGGAAAHAQRVRAEHAVQGVSASAVQWQAHAAQPEAAQLVRNTRPQHAPAAAGVLSSASAIGAA
jgi:hypothetical protein